MSTGDRTSRYPRGRIQSKCMMLVMLALMVGQVALLESAGAGQHAIELHRLTVPFAMLYGFWPEILWAARIADEKVAQIRSNNGVDA